MRVRFLWFSVCLGNPVRWPRGQLEGLWRRLRPIPAGTLETVSKWSVGSPPRACFLTGVLLKKIHSKYKSISKKSELSSLIKDVGFKVNITLGAGDIANEVEQIKNELEYAI